MPNRRAPAAEAIANRAQEKWRSSGITDAQAEGLGFVYLTGDEVQNLAKNFHPVGAMKLPYFDLEGKETGFYRLRYLERLPGFAGAVEKPQRYAQPIDTLNEAYLPPLKVKWAEIAKDIDTPILITEGELKAASACAAGFSCIALGGVDMWRSKKKCVHWFSPLDKIKWKGRVVYVVFDSDAAVKPDVVRAQRALAQELVREHGAMPKIVSLPAGVNGAKQGLDDFLVAHGAEKLEALLDLAPGYEEGDALWALNEELLYVQNPGFVINTVTGQRMKPGDFVAHHYANRHFIGTTPKGEKKQKPLAPAWLAWPHRAEVSKLVYSPGQPRRVEGAWNLWKGWGCTPQMGDVRLWKELLGHVFGGNASAIKWFEQWCAYPIQHPGTKLYTAPLIWSRIKGIGKSLVGYTLMGIYGDNAIEIKSRDLKSTFNSWAQNRQFVVGDEITAGEARTDADHLKGIITQHKVRINVKHLPEYEIADCMNFIFFSNHCDALFVEDDERRYFVWEIENGKMPQDFYDRYDKWLGWNIETAKAEGPGPSALFEHLLHLDLTGFHPKAAAPETNSREHMIRNSKTELGQWVADLRVDPERLLRSLGDKASKEGSLFTPRQLLKAFDPEGKMRHTTEVSLGRQLFTAGFVRVNDGMPVRTSSGVLRLYAVRNGEKWKRAEPAELAKEFDRIFGDTKF